MSRKLLAFLLSELKTVRMVCKHKDCGAVSEIPITQLDKLSAVTNCHVCGGKFSEPYMPGPLHHLGNALSKCRMQSDCFDVEFVIPDEPD